jgi:thioredoxin reductase (NADPH)
VVAGGGNSAGQAALFLSECGSPTTIVIRGPDLAKSMSRYLIDRIAATSNIELMTQTELVALEGTPERGLERVRWRARNTGAETTASIRNVFLFVGADPATGWLAGCAIDLDRNGFVMTGASGGLPLASSMPGVFAVGDVRSGSVKRVGSAIGEGAQVVAALHGFLGSSSQPSV